MIRMAVLLAASLVVTPARPADKAKERPVALERKLHGTWQGPDCVGELTIRPDGTFARQHYSPGNNTLAGTWQMRWDALPPTLYLTCKTSDDSDNVGKTVEVDVVQLDDAVLAYQFPRGPRVPFTRLSPGHDKELAALRGTWMLLRYEEGGKLVQDDRKIRLIVDGDDVTYQENGVTKAEGKVIVDPMKEPRHLTFVHPEHTDLIIYVRAGDYLIYCGNRGGRRPTEFVSGTAKGGAYLMAWKIEK
jgi:uncharacterized protein (TIGR03067 family)